MSDPLFCAASRLIYTLRQYPNTEDFVYLRRLDRNPSDYNPYSLEVVPFSGLNPNDFYVLSIRGITHHLDGEPLVGMWIPRLVPAVFLWYFLCFLHF